MAEKYVLDSHHLAIPCDNLIKWAEWFENADRVVKCEEIEGVTVSTVFLGINHRFGEGDPLLFETMIFGGEHDGTQMRCSTWVEALVQHKDAVALVTDE